MDPKEQETIPVEDQEEIEDADTNKFANLNEGGDVSVDDRIKGEMNELKSIKTWDKLKIDPKLIERLLELGFKTPSKIQATVIPISKKSSVFAQSQNGSGKTLSFLIPALTMVDTSIQPKVGDKIAPQVIILADTRPLIKQLEKIATLLKENVYPDLVIDSLFSGKNPIEGGAHLIITTVGYLNRMCLKRKNIDLSKMKLLVIDEADMVMKSDISTIFLPQLVIKGLAPDMKLILTTATSTEISKTFVSKIGDHKRIITIELEREKLTLKNVQQLYVKCAKKDRLEILEKALTELQAQNILIFINSKKYMRELVQHLQALNHKVVSVSSNAKNKDRYQEAIENQKNIEDFLAGKYRILVTTNLLSRGIDMRKVTLVVNVELPKSYLDRQVYGVTSEIKADCETYLHRVGRTGRYGDHGIALNLVTDEEQQKIHQQIVEFYKIDMAELTVEKLSSLNEKLSEIESYNTKKREQMEENI